MSTESLNNFLEAEKLLKLGKNDEAFHLLAKFIQDESCSLPLRHRNELAKAFNERGYIHYLRVDFQSAIDDYSEAIALNEGFTVAYYNRGLVQYRLGACSSEQLRLSVVAIVCNYSLQVKHQLFLGHGIPVIALQCTCAERWGQVH